MSIFTDIEFELAEIEALLDVVPDGETLQINLVDEDLASFAGGLGSEVHQGTWRDDVITDTGGTNVVYAGRGADKIGLLTGTNTVDGGDSDDLIIGDFGDDDLSGGVGKDVIRGDVSANLFGADTIRGGEDDDLLEGGGGRDVFVFK